MTEWKTMESAPKDGTHILLCISGEIIEGWWDAPPELEGRWEVVWLGYHGCGCCGGGVVAPDYWMELPNTSKLLKGGTSE